MFFAELGGFFQWAISQESSIPPQIPARRCVFCSVLACSIWVRQARLRLSVHSSTKANGKTTFFCRRVFQPQKWRVDHFTADTRVLAHNLLTSPNGEGTRFMIELSLEITPNPTPLVLNP
jgi:hypothetical protein